MNNSATIQFTKDQPLTNPICIDLPASKSISNRLLMLKHLYFPQLIIQNLSGANDTQLMQRALLDLKEAKTIDVEDAGTVARFILAAALFSEKELIITGTERMQARPIEELIEVLKTLGASITFIKKDLKLPFKITGISSKIKHTSNIQLSISTTKSSQFLSAILMIAPQLNQKVTIQLSGERNSWSYVEMTIQIMRSFGFIIDLNENTIVIEPFIPHLDIKTYKIENDWSAASFMVEILSHLPANTAFLFNNLHLSAISLQGDAVLSLWAQDLNLEYNFTNNNSIFEVIKSAVPFPERSFKNNPDLALPYLMSMVLQKKIFTIHHVESLQFKESDRMAAIKEELFKCNVHFTQCATGYIIDASLLEVKPYTEFNSHKDHRIAMSLAPLAMFAPITILNPEVVNKSFPMYWDVLRKLNFEVIYN
jgi:3-phosphoshikimate 1-carboxyvinyltransferase